MLYVCSQLLVIRSIPGGYGCLLSQPSSMKLMFTNFSTSASVRCFAHSTLLAMFDPGPVHPTSANRTF